MYKDERTPEQIKQGRERVRLFFIALLIGFLIGVANGLVIGVVCF